MARDLAPIVKRSRREKTPLHPKAVKGLTVRNYAPGQHGQSNLRAKLSQYAIQLREKQKVKRMYGLLEKQFRRVIAEAQRQAVVEFAAVKLHRFSLRRSGSKGRITAFQYPRSNLHRTRRSNETAYLFLCPDCRPRARFAVYVAACFGDYVRFYRFQ